MDAGSRRGTHASARKIYLSLIHVSRSVYFTTWYHLSGSTFFWYSVLAFILRKHSSSPMSLRLVYESWYSFTSLRSQAHFGDSRLANSFNLFSVLWSFLKLPSSTDVWFLAHHIEAQFLDMAVLSLCTSYQECIYLSSQARFWTHRYD